MVGWHHQLNGYEFEQVLGDGEGQGSLVCYNPCGHKELDMTEWLNNSKELKHTLQVWGFILIMIWSTFIVLWLLGCALSDTLCLCSQFGRHGLGIVAQLLLQNVLATPCILILITFSQPAGTAGLWNGVRFYATWKDTLEGQQERWSEGPRLQEVREYRSWSPLAPCPHRRLLSQLKSLDHPVLVLVLGSVRPLGNQIWAALRAYIGLSRWLSGKESTCQCRRRKRCGFNPWVRKIPWSRKWQPTPTLAWEIQTSFISHRGHSLLTLAPEQAVCVVQQHPSRVTHGAMNKGILTG